MMDRDSEGRGIEREGRGRGWGRIRVGEEVKG